MEYNYNNEIEETANIEGRTYENMEHQFDEGETTRPQLDDALSTGVDMTPIISQETPPHRLKQSKKVKNNRKNKSNHIKEERKKEVSEEPTVKNLFLITDRDSEGLGEALKDYGIYPVGIYHHIVNAKNDIIMHEEKSRIIIIDSGTGRFTGSTARREIVDLLDISDEDNNVTVFYTDEALREETQQSNKVRDDVEWIQYNSSIQLIYYLKANGNERYEFNGQTEVEKSEEDTGVWLRESRNVIEEMSQNLDRSIDLVDIREMLSGSSGDNPITAYKISV